MFRIGQKVVCVNTGKGAYGEITPVLGEVYTIREVKMHRKGPGYRLVEIVNAPADYAQGVMECSFAHSCFRPVVERKTDISFAHEILRKTSRKQTVKAH